MSTRILFPTLSCISELPSSVVSVWAVGPSISYSRDLLLEVMVLLGARILC